MSQAYVATDGRPRWTGRSRQTGGGHSVLTVHKRTQERQTRTPVLRVLLVLVVALPLGACASLRGVMVPVSQTVAGASQVDMLVATTRKRADPAELFSGDRGPAAAFAN